MKFHDKVKGKIIISVDKLGERLDSSIELKGLANEPDICITTLLINFISECLRHEKDPKSLFEKNVNRLEKMVKNKGN